MTMRKSKNLWEESNMKRSKRILAMVCALLLAVLMLTACGGGGGGSSSGTNKPANSGSSTPTNPEQPGSSNSEKPSTPAMPQNWSESKTRKFFADRGITEENMYVSFHATDGEENQADVIYAAYGGRRSMDVTGEENGKKYHTAGIIDEKGNAYDIDYNEKSVTTYPAENRDDDSEGEMGYVKIFVPVPTDAMVGMMSAGSYQYNNQSYYCETIKINRTIENTTIVGTWDYLYDDKGELRYIFCETPNPTVSEIKTISSNPPDSCFALPNWNQESATGTSRTVQYFKSNGIANKRFYLEGTYSNNYEERVYYTLDGEKGYMASVPSGSTKPDYGIYVASKDEAYVINYNDKTYRREDYNAQNYLESIQNAIYNPAVSGYQFMKIGTYQEGTKTYYKETFRPMGDRNSSYTTYDFVFDGNKLVYILRNNGYEKLKVVELTGTPKKSLLQLPDGYTEETYN